jgi:hypothetical protein
MDDSGSLGSSASNFVASFSSPNVPGLLKTDQRSQDSLLLEWSRTADFWIVALLSLMCCISVRSTVLRSPHGGARLSSFA